MSRDGFLVADVDTGLYFDAKVSRLARSLGDPLSTLAALALYEALRLASWRAGRRLAIEETIPPVALTLDVGPLLAGLEAAHLIESDGTIPEATWLKWFEPADRRRREGSLPRVVGGLVAQGMTRETALTEARSRLRLDSSANSQAEAVESPNGHAGSTPANSQAIAIQPSNYLTNSPSPAPAMGYSQPVDERLRGPLVWPEPGATKPMTEEAAKVNRDNARRSWGPADRRRRQAERLWEDLRREEIERQQTTRQTEDLPWA